MATATTSRYLALANALMIWSVMMIMLYAYSSTTNNGYKNHVTAFAPIRSIRYKTSSKIHHPTTTITTTTTRTRRVTIISDPHSLEKVSNVYHGTPSQLFFFRKIFGMNNQENKHDDDGDDDDDGEKKQKHNDRGKKHDQVLKEKEGQKDIPQSERDDSVQDNMSNKEKSSKEGPLFFARLADWRKKEDVIVPSTDQDALTLEKPVDSSVAATDALEEVESSTPATKLEPNSMPEPETAPPPKEMSPKEKAEALKAQAERARLEAEKMDVLLTLEKIEKLEKELGSKAVSNDPKRVQDVTNQISSLKKKLTGNDRSNAGGKDSSSKQKESLNGKKDLDAVLSSVVSETRDKTKVLNNQSLSMDETMQQKVKQFQEAPTFMQEIVTKSLGMEMNNDLNATDVVLKLYKDEKVSEDGVASSNLSFRNEEQDSVPEFTQEQIDEVLQAVQLLPKFLKNMYGDDIKNNDTAIALMLLEEEWRSGNLVVMPEITQEMINDKLEEIKWIPQYLRGENSTELAIELIKSDFRRNKGKQNSSSTKLATAVSQETQPIKQGEDTANQEEKNSGFSIFGGQQKSDKDQMVESLFPESTRKKDEEINEGQAVLFMSEVLAKDNVWVASGPPEKVSGGFLIRGSTRFETGKELIEAIDNNLAKSRVRNQVNCFYIFDPTPVTEEQMSSGERPPVLFVTAPNVARDPAPVQRSLISAVTFGTIWYNSLLPFLLNDKYLKLTEEQVALADASMPSNVDFLNDLSFPLFATTVGIQAIHELSHFIAARNNNLNITTPTLVPSLGTGLLGGITSLKNPPRDKQSLFDFAIAGPLAGMGASVMLLIIGMVATISMDAASYENLPALPFNLLRQSSLAGGIINSISPGLLTVPDAALGSKALSEINIPLHPFAIAGYFGLMINAVNLLPVGRTDGGRIALTLFGRSGTQLVSFLTFVFMFIQGILGSDLILFFFSFVVFFQSELEIPQRNEVDDMDFSRVLLATATGVLVLLALIPM